MAERISFFPLDITYKVHDGRAVIYMYGKTRDGQRICVRDRNFQPYFYVMPIRGRNEELRARLKDLKINVQGAVVEVRDVEQIEKSYAGKKVQLLRVIPHLPAHVPVLRDAVKKWDDVRESFEDDILFTRRYMIDKSIIPFVATGVTGVFSPEHSHVPIFDAENVTPSEEESLNGLRILAFDIETYNPTGKGMYPEKNPILMVAFYSMDNGKEFQKIVTWKGFENAKDYVEFVDGEMRLLERFKEIIEQYKPDIITGYFSDGFDFPYIVARAQKYKISMDIGLDRSTVTINKKQDTVEVTGIPHVDIFKFVRRILGRNMDTDVFTLEAVATELLDEHKHDVDLDKLAVVWDTMPQELEKYCEYNLHDARITFKLCEKLMPNMEELVKIIGLPIVTVTRMSFSRLVESYIMRQTATFHELIPNRPGYRETSFRSVQSYEGAFVFQPTAGLYENIVIFDFRSLYPSIITSHNISPGTLNCACCHDVVPGEKYWFCHNQKGFLPAVLESIVSRRARIKEIIKSSPERNILLEARSEALKLLANSFYGYLGFAAARWYSIECARSVTALGRHYIQLVITEAQNAGFTVLYSDTDSIFLKLASKTKEDARSFIDGINERLPGIMELEYEGFYPVGLFVSAKASGYGAKKKYALLTERGKLKIKGFETVRRNWSVIAKEVQKRVLEIVLREQNKTKALDYIRGIVSDLQEHRLPVEKVIISTQIQRPLDAYESVGPHVAVARRMSSRGMDVGQGILVQFVITTGKGVIRDRARIPDEVNQTDYDASYYIGNQVIPSVERICAVLGIDIQGELVSKEQSTLGKFFH